jgi:hypothetical protein
MDQTKEPCKTISFREQLEAAYEARPFDSWDLGWNAAIRHILEILDNTKD